MKGHLNYFVRSAIDWLFRPRHPALFLVRGGLLLTSLLFAGWAVSVSLSTTYGPLSIGFDSDRGMPTPMAYGVFGLSLLLIVVGIIWYRADQKRLARKKVIVVETRGLRDLGGMPLIDAVPSKLRGHHEQVLVDLRQRLQDGFILEPNAAVERLVTLPIELERRESGFDRRDISYVYGGLAPVPLTFLTGVLMDDEGAVLVMDWDRHAECWRELDDDDDGVRFKIAGLTSIQPGTVEVALAVSVSYQVDLSGLRQRLGELPIVQLQLEGGTPDSHWSEAKQQALGKQFLETAINLANLGAIRLHLFMAAQNSVVFRFGRLYDKRNLPEIIIYQYQREERPPYTWGLKMPVSGVKIPEVVT